MDKQTIIDYVMHTPHNTNPAVLGGLLEQLGTEPEVNEALAVIAEKFGMEETEGKSNGELLGFIAEHFEAGVGAQILDFTGVEFEAKESADETYVASVTGFYDLLKESNKKPVLVKGFNPLGYTYIPSDFYASFTVYDENPEEEEPAGAVAYLNDGSVIEIKSDESGDGVTVYMNTYPMRVSYHSSDEFDDIRFTPIGFDGTNKKGLFISMNKAANTITFNVGGTAAVVDADFDVD